MCKASKRLDEFNNLLKNIKKDHEDLFKELSKYDIMISEHYHKIETMNFNACEGYYLTRQLQETLRKRRILKDEISRLTTLMQTLKFKNLHENIKHSKQCLHNAKQKSFNYQKDWKYTYTLEEVLH